VTQSSFDIKLAPREREAQTSAEFLCVDLDGTILLVDSFFESFLSLIGTRPWFLFFIPFWLLRGKAVLKHEVSRRVTLNVSTFPVRDELVEVLRREKRNGKKLILATGADAKIAGAVAAHLGLFDAVLASDGITNLTGPKKREAIQKTVCGKKFDYIGNSWQDIPVWKAANSSIVVAPSPRLLKTLRQSAVISGVLSEPENRWASLWQSLRPQHWVKNLLVLVPIVMAHDLTDVSRLLRVLVGCVSFSLCASGVYLLNDMLDVEADRLHPRKKLRPIASGKLPVWVGLSLAPLLLAAGLTVAALLPMRLFLGIVACYVAATTLYSTYAKRIPILDVLLLTTLYLLRILGGGAAADVPVSPWLLAFAMFILLSLAFSKRQAELMDRTANGGGPSKRGYRPEDAGLIQQFGVTSGYLSVLVLALYVNGADVARLYRHPQVIWLACPMLLFWISRVWFLANRGKLSEDPVVFAARDPVSYALGICLLLILLVAS
jgi:4-hydroxybenzoate polyprenyltransferase/phosphoserine phosphatase